MSDELQDELEIATAIVTAEEDWPLPGEELRRVTAEHAALEAVARRLLKGWNLLNVHLGEWTRFDYKQQDDITEPMSPAEVEVIERLRREK